MTSDVTFAELRALDAELLPERTVLSTAGGGGLLNGIGGDLGGSSGLIGGLTQGS